MKSKVVRLGNQRARRLSLKFKGPTFVGQTSIQAQKESSLFMDQTVINLNVSQED